MHNNMIKDFERSDKEKIYYTKKLNFCEEKKSEILRQINSTTNKEINSELWFSNIDLIRSRFVFNLYRYSFLILTLSKLLSRFRRLHQILLQQSEHLGPAHFNYKLPSV